MAFDLPRRQPSLRFTGEVRSLGSDEKKETMVPPARRGAPPPPASVRAPMPPLAQPRKPRSPSGIDTPTKIKMETVRGTGLHRALPSLAPVDDDDDDRETLCMDRDALDVALLPDARLAQPRVDTPMPAGQLPVPGFRSIDDVLRQQQATMQVPAAAPRGGPVPLVVWLIASVVLAVLSFFAAPVARDQLTGTVQSTPAR